MCKSLTHSVVNEWNGYLLFILSNFGQDSSFVISLTDITNGAEIEKRQTDFTNQVLTVRISKELKVD